MRIYAFTAKLFIIKRQRYKNTYTRCTICIRIDDLQVVSQRRRNFALLCNNSNEIQFLAGLNLNAQQFEEGVITLKRETISFVISSVKSARLESVSISRRLSSNIIIKRWTCVYTQVTSAVLVKQPQTWWWQRSAALQLNEVKDENIECKECGVPSLQDTRYVHLANKHISLFLTVRYVHFVHTTHTLLESR